MTISVDLSFFGKDARSRVRLRDGQIIRTGIDFDLSRRVLAEPAVAKLMARGDLVETRLESNESEGPLLQHRRIEPFTYPGEWSFSMLRDAALLTLEVREVLAGASLDLKDAHSYNVTFDCCRPVYTDFASIEKTDSRYQRWRAGSEFLDAFVRILRIWSMTNRTCALSFLNAVWARPDDEALIRYGRTAHHLRSGVRNAWSKALVATAMTSEARRDALARLVRSDWKRGLARPALSGLEALQRWRGHPFDTASLRSAVQRLEPPVAHSEWAAYQSGLALHDSLTPRFQRILELIGELRVVDAFEIAGNQGALSEALVDRGVVKSCICSDYDEHAVDALYLRLRKRPAGRAVTPMVRNAMLPDPIRSGNTRDLRCDAVIALALTHHLLLTQGYTLDAVLERIAAHSRRLMIVEFMPRGLWDGTAGAPVPSWYTKEWFVSGLQRHGRIIHEERLEENRIVYVVQLGALR